MQQTRYSCASTNHEERGCSRNTSIMEHDVDIGKVLFLYCVQRGANVLLAPACCCVRIIAYTYIHTEHCAMHAATDPWATNQVSVQGIVRARLTSAAANRGMYPWVKWLSWGNPSPQHPDPPTEPIFSCFRCPVMSSCTMRRRCGTNPACARPSSRCCFGKRKFLELRFCNNRMMMAGVHIGGLVVVHAQHVVFCTAIMQDRKARCQTSLAHTKEPASPKYH